MNEPPISPSRLLRLLAGFARWSLGLLVAVWLLAAVAWGILHGLIVPRIGEFRSHVETQVAKALGVPVRIGGLQASSDGFIPTLELSGVALLDPSGREALRLEQVVAAISPRSLLRLGFEQLYLKNPELDVRRDAEGRIFVAGLQIQGTGKDDGAATDWLFSQSEVAIVNGRVRWTDELRGAPPITLSELNLIMRNGHWRHRLRVDATPPEGWGGRFSLRGEFREPILTVHGNDWRTWSGQLYADLPDADVSRLNQYADLGALKVSEGHGAVRAWVDVRKGVAVGAVADLGLSQVRATLGKTLQPLAVHEVTGRIGVQRFAGGFEASAQDLAFVTHDGLRWPAATLFLSQTGVNDTQPSAERGELRASSLNLQVLAQIADRLPLEPSVHDRLREASPRGIASNVHLAWHGPIAAPEQYEANGLVQDLSLGMPGGSGAAAKNAASRVAGKAPPAEPPGIQGARVEFSVTQAGGSAQVDIKEGALHFPGVFEEPLVPIQQLHTKVSWQIDGDRIAVQAPQVRFANADAAGEAKFAWRTADARKSASGSRFPGVLELSGSASRADGTRVHRYLPLGVPQDARHYVREAVTAGVASKVDFRVKGDLNDFPFKKPGQGDFRIAAQVRNVNYQYVPAFLQSQGELPWPALTNLSGELVFERAGMKVNNANGTLGGVAQVKVSNTSAEIPDLDHPVVGVDATARGPLADMLGLVRTSHIAQLTEHALDDARATGNTELRLQLSLPVNHIADARVQGNVKLAGNDVRFTPDVPEVTQAHGAVQFSEAGFSLSNVQGRALGGDVRLEGGMRALPREEAGRKSAVSVRAQGTATAEGLRSVAPAGPLADLAAKASGTTPYSVDVGVLHGAVQLAVNTTLQGMRVQLPAPLGKPAEGELPVRFEKRLVAADDSPAAAPLWRDHWSVQVGDVGAVHYVLEPATAEQPARVLQGALAFGAKAPERLKLPASGVVAHVVLDDLDLDAWESALDASSVSTKGANPAAARLQGGMEFVPSSMHVQARSIEWKNRVIHNVKADFARQPRLWLLNMQADELAGQAEYREAGDNVPAPGLIRARLQRLTLPESHEAHVDDLLSEEPRDLPAMDIVVEDFRMRGREMGRIEVMARNSTTREGQREWLLSHLNLIAPEATFRSSGRWALERGQGSHAQRRTTMQFELHVRDSGELLSRFGMSGVVRKGKGVLHGEVAWIGAPLSPDYPSMTGRMKLDMQTGQFLKADPGLAKLLSVLSLQSIPRRLSLDFRDIFSEGFAFDFVRGDVRIDRGVATTNNLQMKGLNAAVLMEGKADLERETQDLHVVVVPEINAMTASLVATAINPVIGLGSFLAQIFLRGPLIQAATQEFRIDGTWSDPRVERVARGSKAAAEAAKMQPESGASAPHPEGETSQ